jgi:hypothetical protein
MLKEKGKTIAKAILSWKTSSSVGNVGFIDWENDPIIAKCLIGHIEEKARTLNLKELKTPVDLNFFVKYRIKKPGGGDPFYGEPIYPDYYHDMFLSAGFQVIETWDTYKLRKWETFKDFLRKGKKLREKKNVARNKFKMRTLKISRWDEELKLMYDLFLKSFRGMSEFEPISFEQFRTVYNDFKYIIHSWFVFIIELNGNPVGFSINYPDPLAILSQVKGKKLNLIDKVILMGKLKINFKTLLVAYLGKVSGPSGEEIKGVQAMLSKKIYAHGLVAGKELICYQSSSSPSKRAFEAQMIQPYSQYVLYGKFLK